ncbi:preprotein translocase, SecG subunit [Desulfofarcimen acetoxidans DSM 771]|uniref:Protein-export membrane protein SecG n=1 Tax=Desulfofarcimen acetoxidans (strain ATCC 49208 / DSM 771 / KCTC 5769 / VKM B-1644 / 5575) TaxID=485916 RepID=C8VXZ6_DESAS|nr:preprotein translocase subunit SecG [Desulfofarcimen acetoxidans]ACV64625.1 preprotein translocase, SecG subunit [Desulfofarcimen acetoxidans DSM 771]
MLKGIVTALHVLLALGIIASVLLQSGRSAGLSGAIAGGAETLFGKKKGLDELLGKVTVLLSVLFVVISLVLTVWK